MLNDLVNLKVSYDSIKKIEEFLSSNKGVNKQNYFKALVLLAKMYINLGEENKGIQIIENLLNDDLINKYNNILIDSYDLLINLYIENETFDEAKKYINLKQTKTNQTYLYLFDLANLYHKLGQYTDEKMALSDMLQYDMPDELRISIYERMIDILLEEESYQYALSYQNGLNMFLKLVDNQNAYNLNLYKGALIKYNLEEYDYLDELENTHFDNKNLEGLRLVLIIKTYFKLGMYQKCMILEGSLDSVILEYNDIIKRDFYQTCINLYNKIYNKDAINYYTDKLNNLKIDNSNIKKAKKELKKIAIINKKKIDSKKEELYDALTNVTDLIKSLSEINLFDKPRNVLMHMGRITEAMINFSDIILLFDNNLYHYKKQRVYDKQITDFTNTILDLAISNETEEVFKDKSEMIKYKDIITNKKMAEIDVENAITKPIYVNDVKRGGILIYGKNNLLNGFNYELLNVFINILVININRSIILNKYKDESNLFNDMLNLSEALIKLERGSDIYLSNALAKKLGVINSIDKSEFRSLVDNKYQYKLDSSDLYIEYKIKDRYYKEEIKNIENGKISILTDITKEFDYLNQISDLKYKDYVTNLKNRTQLKIDFKPLNKYSICVVDIKNFKEINRLYGLVFSDNILKRLADTFIDYFGYENVYKLLSDEFLIIIDKNDVRSINNIFKEVFELVDSKMASYNKRLSLQLAVGVVRCPNQKDDGIDKLINYASIAKRSASNEIKNMHQIMHFDQATYNKFKDDDITSAHIVEAIDHDLLRINYRPILDKKTKKLHSYFLTFSVMNYDVSHELILDVCKKRGIIGQIERYLFRKAIEELKIFIDKYKMYYNIILHITRIDKEFLDMLKKYQKTNLLNYFIFIIDDNSYINELRNLGIFIASKNITDLVNEIDYLIIPNGSRLNGEAINNFNNLAKSLKCRTIYEADLDFDINLFMLDKAFTFDELIKRVK